MKKTIKKRALSGIRCSGIIHIGNYLGAIKGWVENQAQNENIYFLADLHALTTPFNPKELKENIYSSLATYLACGLNPKKTILFLQSQRHEHTELAWILSNLSYMGELGRMTQFKDKSAKMNHDAINLGLFSYPVLMAADILLYQPDFVPVGEDQAQHVELARDLAKRFNNRFGETFKIPKTVLIKEGARIMGLDDPIKKMSKSAESSYNYIALTDDVDTIRRKISKAVTDSGRDIKFDPKRPGLYNLLTIYRLFADLTPVEIENKFAGRGYGDFKKTLTELLIEKLAPIQERYFKLVKDKKYLDAVLHDGKERAEKLAQKTLEEVKNKIGMI